jgi:hypothetical protein
MELDTRKEPGPSPVTISPDRIGIGDLGNKESPLGFQGSEKPCQNIPAGLRRTDIMKGKVESD